MDKFSHILNRIYIVMRRWRNQPHSRRRPANFCNLRKHLVTGQFSSLPGLSALRNLNLQLLGVDQVMAVDAKTSTRDLLDGAFLRVPVG